MSGGIFYLDEDRDRDQSPSPSPRPSPRASPTLSASDPRSSPLTQPSSSTSTSAPPLLQIPSPGAPNVFTTQPQSKVRKHATSFAATPSFPSPLAQAITVPTHSDTSSSDSHSEEEEADAEDGSRTIPVSPSRSNTSGTPRLVTDHLPRPRTVSPHTSRSGSPSSIQKPPSRPPSPKQPQDSTASSLIKGKRSSSVSLLAGSLANAPAKDPSTIRGPPLRISPTHPGHRRFSNVARTESASTSPTSPTHRRGSSGNIVGPGDLALGTPEQEAAHNRDASPSRSFRAGSNASSRDSKDVSANILGLGWGSGMSERGWDSATTSSPGSVTDKGRAKDFGSGSSSPRTTQRERERTVQPIGMASPPRQRRPSEFLNPTGEARKMPMVGPRASMSAAHLPSLSTSASMISPLNPLPSPWAEDTESSAFSAPKPQPTQTLPVTSSTPGAIRLNRVPTSVRLAADLIKNTPVTQSSTPSAESSVSTASVPTPNPSPAGSAPTPSHVKLPTGRELGAFSSLPLPQSRVDGDTPLISQTKGQLPPPLTLESSISPEKGKSTAPVELQKKASTSTLAPPSAFKAPLPPSRPSNQIPTSANIVSTTGTFMAPPKTHRYRTSMHEASFKRPLSLLEESGGSTLPEHASKRDGKPPPFGLGLNMPSAIPLETRKAEVIGSGSITPGALPQPRQRSTTGKELRMDLAGIGALGDAASHASMIMQSRQAKLQRWRPNSAGKQEGQEIMLPPAFNRSTTTGAPAMLAAPRVGRQSQWGVVDNRSPTAASSPGEDLPPIPSTFNELIRVGSLPVDSLALQVGGRPTANMPLKSNAGPSRMISPALAAATNMERQHSAGGTVGGIEWVDWYDCYKRYKDAKIRAEADEAARQNEPVEASPTENQSTFASISHSPTDAGPDELRGRPSPREIELASNKDDSSAIALTPQTSRDDFALQERTGLRRRSMSIRSAMSSLDPTRSPNQKRTALFERPRQTSGSSIRSNNTESSSSGVISNNKKKKNLVNKMEGWWNAVKSNFIPEGHSPNTHRPLRPSNLGVYPSRRIPSAPTSRRGSDMSPIATPEAALLAPEPMRRDSTQSLRQVTSHSELRARPHQYDSQRLQAAASIVSSTSADIARLSRSSMADAGPEPFAMGRTPSIVPEEQSRYPSRVPSSLEARRRGQGVGTSLRLELDSNVLRADPSRPQTSVPPLTQQRTMSSRMLSTQSSSGASSYGNPLYGPGLTPGIARWDHTPSPIYPVSTVSRDEKEDRPVAPGADITVASVRRHIKHRLNAAKDICDNTLRKAIDAMTKFADEQKEQQAYNAELADQQQDYFDSISDSPLVDAEESEAEGGDAFDDGFRSRHASTSRPPSRRPSISRPMNIVGASPNKRLAMLPSSPSRVRRRPSVVPRHLPGQTRISRHTSLSLDRTASAASSRSTSRSRSPMPTSTRGLLTGAEFEAAEDDKRFLLALQDLIVLATEVLDSSVNALVTNTGSCAELVQKLQRVGSSWDDHEDWPGREWYVDILMAVANLSRVLDWWQAEKGFWNFDDDDENEPLVFVLKPSGQGKEEPKFDRDFGAALTSQRSSPVNPVLQLPDPPTSGVSFEVPPSDSTMVGTAKQVETTPNVVAANDLQVLADHAKSVNIVMELGLQGEEIQYVNDAIMEVIGRDPEDVLNLAITELLAPADASVFADATQKLLEDDNNTVQLRFRFEVHELESASHPPLQPGPVYIELEGVGMLMRENDQPSHTMWVLKPVTATQLEVDSSTDAAFPREGYISTEGILCRICERQIVTWFFEKHNETCDAVHRLEAEITGCDECLHDLSQTVGTLAVDIEDVTADSSPQYSGVLFFSLPDSITSGHETTIPTGPQGVEVRKVVQESLHDVIGVLQMAQTIEVPSVQEDEADLPFNVQRYLSRDSEEKLQRITRWQRPSCTDRALSLLFSHVEEQLRRKQKAIARMQSTIRYSEKTRHEWEDKVNRVFNEDSESSPSESGSDGAEPVTTPMEVSPEATAETSPPGPRRIAPQARLPITQSHPQRPSTSHGEHSSASIPPTPVHTAISPAHVIQPPNSAPLPAEATFKPMVTSAPQPVHLSQTRSDTLSPLLAASEFAGGHSRRPSSSKPSRDGPLSPRIPSTAVPLRTAQPSIKDFQIIKPISRGAFGSVYLAKKVATGDYFAIKALKKSDMIAKNQITNVKAERTILMNQASSPYVAKLFFSFQSKEYLYLVMEYLNGGDCASLVKTLGGLPEEWATNYTAEVVLGLEYLHSRNIVHRDIKPDNLLIDSRGHLKLTDFGLSRIGLLNRQVGGPRPAYLRGTSIRGSMKRRPTNHRNDSGSSGSPTMSPELLPAQSIASRNQSYFAVVPDIDTADESSGSESAGLIPRHMRTLSMANKLSADASTPPRFVGTPDYLAPESILGIGSDDKAVDWWALGVVLYEFLYGIPPFHADTPEKVFDNVVSRRIDWHEDEIEISPAARDLMDRLMCSDPARRIGARGADEVKQHAFFAGLNWHTITTSEASFVPEVTDPESTDYFDSRGAAHAFLDEDAVPQVSKQPGIVRAQSELPSPATATAMDAIIDDIEAQDDFGAFNFKNLPVLKQANDDVIRKLRSDSMAPIGQTLDAGVPLNRRPRSLSIKLRGTGRRKASDSAHSHLIGGPPSPSTSTSSAASTPSRASIPPSTPGSIPIPSHHFRRPSELNALERVKSSQDSDVIRRASAPSRVRAGSGSSISERSSHMGLWRKRRQVSLNSEATNASSAQAGSTPLDSPESHTGYSSMGDRTLDVLIAEDNPISQKILETLLTRMGCRCICVEDGPQALAATMGSIRFDVIICDIHMPVVNGEQVARMIRSTNNHNQNTPIIAATSYEQHRSITEEGTLFSAVLAKPVSKADLIKCLDKLGFILSSTGSTSTNDAVSTGTPV